METAVIFFIWRLFDLTVSLLAGQVVPYLGFFPYKGMLDLFQLPAFLSHFASFDGVHYLKIAEIGYGQNEQAFFPLYPLAIRALTFLTGNGLIAGLLISNLAFLVGMYVFRKFAKTAGSKTGNVSPILFLLAFPTSFFFGAVYTEGLFFLLFISALFFLKKKNYWLAGVCAALASSTRLIGVFLFIPFAVELLWQKQNSLKMLFFRTLRFSAVLFSPLAGFAAYAAYLWKTVGDPLFFFHAQPSFGANRSTNLILLPQVYYRYVKIFFTAAPNFQYFTSVIEFLSFTFIFLVLILDLLKYHSNRDRLALNLFSFANLILPTLTGTFSSVPRYALFSVSAFMFLSEIKSLRLRGALFIILILLHTILLSFFIQGYFIS